MPSELTSPATASRGESMLDSLSALLDRLPVSGFEERAYDWLLGSFWRERLSHLPRSKRSAVGIEFLASGQLCVSYTGDSASKHRLVFICHVDREGLVARLGPVQMYSYGTRADASVLRRKVDGLDGSEDYIPYVKNREVCVSGGYGRPQITNCLFGVDNNTQYLESPVGHSAAWLFGEKQIESRVAITPIDMSSEFSALAPESARLRSGQGEVLNASALDNAAGVVIATHAMLRIIESQLAANVSVVYTIGEESGFLGAIALACDPPIHLWNHEALHAIVVDTSSRAFSFGVGLGELRRMAQEGRPLSRSIRPVDQRRAYVRLCDRGTVFSGSLSRFLIQSAIDVHQDLHMPCGLFVGGYCDGSVLALADRLRESAGATDGTLWASCGAIAIPLGNYRGLESSVIVKQDSGSNVDDSQGNSQCHPTDKSACPQRIGNTSEAEDQSGALKPEFIMLGAIASAADLLVSAAKMQQGYQFVGDAPAYPICDIELDDIGRIVLDPADDVLVASRLEKWCSRYRGANSGLGRLATLRVWAQTGGQRLRENAISGTG